MVAFAFSVLDWKYLFWTNWVSKFKIVSLSWNLVPTRIWVCSIQWCSLLLFLTINTLPRANLVQKIKTVTVSWNLLPTLFWICRIQWCCSLFSFVLQFLFKKIHLAFWCYLINVPATYFQRLEASGFSCYN